MNEFWFWAAFITIGVVVFDILQAVTKQTTISEWWWTESYGGLNRALRKILDHIILWGSTGLIILLADKIPIWLWPFVCFWYGVIVHLTDKRIFGKD